MVFIRHMQNIPSEFIYNQDLLVYICVFSFFYFGKKFCI